MDVNGWRQEHVTCFSYACINRVSTRQCASACVLGPPSLLAFACRRVVRVCMCVDVWSMMICETKLCVYMCVAGVNHVRR